MDTLEILNKLRRIEKRFKNMSDDYVIMSFRIDNALPKTKKQTVTLTLRDLRRIIKEFGALEAQIEGRDMRIANLEEDLRIISKELQEHDSQS